MIPRGFVKFRADAVGFALRDRIKHVLTIVPESTSSFKSEPETIRLWAEEGEFFSVPRGVFNDKLRGKYVDEHWFDFSDGSNKLMPSDPISLRPGQEEIIAGAVQAATRLDFGGAIIEAKTGAGKTVLGMETCRRLGKKILLIVHTSVLASQWETEIKRFMPTWRIGRLQADKIDVLEKDIVIGTTQSASLKDYPESVYKEFGTILADEVHVLGAPEFGKVLHRFAPRYVIGLTGTLKRADKAENVFIYGIGPIIRGMDKIEVLKPKVYLIDTGFAWWGHGNEEKNLDRQKPYFLKSAILSNERNEIIVRQTMRAAQAQRNILILSERVSHVETLAAELKRRGLASVGVMVGSTKQSERDAAQKAQVICATNKLVGTGFNEPRLDTLIFATPIQEVVQPSGRVLRTQEGKKQPMILDMVDSNCRMAMILSKSRYNKFVNKGWEVYGGDVFQKMRRR